MLPKLQKNQRLNEIIAQNPLKYVKTSEIVYTESQPIVVGSACHTHELLIFIHKIIEASLEEFNTCYKILQDATHTTRIFLKEKKRIQN